MFQLAACLKGIDTFFGWEINSLRNFAIMGFSAYRPEKVQSNKLRPGKPDFFDVAKTMNTGKFYTRTFEP